MTISKIKVSNTTHDLHDARIPGIDSTPTSDSTNVITSGGVYSAIDNAIEGISQDVSDKADKVSGATAGNLAGLDANGNIYDSGKKASEFVSTGDLNTALATKQNTLTFDNAPTAGSNNPVKSSGIKTAVDAKYTKPVTGIPKTDLISGVQSSLDLADSAVQAEPVGDVAPAVTPYDYATREELKLHTMPNTVQLIKNGQPVYPVTDVSLVIGLEDAIKLPPVKVTTLPTASADTAGKMYYVGPDANDEYERYITSAVNGSYSWIDLGDTSIPLPSIADNLTTNDANTALSAKQGKVLDGKISQLGQKVDDLDDFVFDETTGKEQVPVTILEGYYANSQYANYISDSSRRSTDKISVVPGEKYLVTTNIGNSGIIAWLMQWNGTTVVGNAPDFSAGSGNAVDREYIVPEGVDTIAVGSTNTTAPSLKKVVQQQVPKIYTKTEADTLFATNASVVKHSAQTLTDSEKAQARTNIGAVSSSDFSELDDEVTDIKTATTEMGETHVSTPLTMYTEGGVNGYRTYTYGLFIADNSRRTSVLVDVEPGDKFLVSTHLGSSQIAAAIGYNADGTYANKYWELGNGTQRDLVDELYTVPEGVYKVAFQSSNTTEPTVKKVTPVVVSKSYTKTESNNRYQEKTSFVLKKYGIRWSLTDTDDEGERCFDAVGLSVTIGIGNTNGSSDFDNIYPWSEMKRCNIKTNANGAKIVTFEGETGFALDGTNGDVFVRIPKFYVERYKADGYEYRVISATGTNAHPAFIEDGEELDEIFIGAFEGMIDNSKLRSVSGIIPTNNEVGATFLTAAKENGLGFSLYDMRCVDALWTLIAVEFGKRNSNRIFGYGYADFLQPIQHNAYNVSVAATNTNTITLGLPIDDAERRKNLNRLRPGTTVTICDGSQFNIVAQRKITAVSQESVSDNLVITFDGTPIDVTTAMFAGSGPCVTNYCESMGNDVKLNWHTGRGGYVPVNTTAISANTINPCRYRWIENFIGSLWHFLPDVSFNALQMYYCKNMRDYEMHKIIPPYMPVGGLLTKNTDNGNKADVANANYWITSLVDFIFAKGVTFGATYDKSLTSAKAFGGYYYLYDTKVCIVNGGGFDHLYRCNILTQRAWVSVSNKWYLYGARLMYKNILPTD